MELEYTSAGCNRCVGNVAWNDEGIVAFGSHRVVVLYNIEVRAFSCLFLLSASMLCCMAARHALCCGWVGLVSYFKTYI